MASHPSISNRALHKLLGLCPELGLDPLTVSSQAGLGLVEPEGRSPIASLHSLWEVMSREVGRDDLALLCAPRYAPGDYGLVGFVCMNCATLGDALGQLVRFVALWCDEPAMQLSGDGSLSLSYRTPFSGAVGLRLATESAFAEVLTAARLLTGEAVSALEVCFRHPAPRDPSAHQAFFGPAVRFGAQADLLRFGPEHLQLALPRADPQLGAYLRALATEAVERRAALGDEVQQRLRELLAEELQRGVPGLPKLARRMAMSERTLRRRLERSGTTYRQLLDATRGELARGYIRDRRLPLAEVAFLLGFSEPSTFHRAFRRWTDMTPSAWRQRHDAQ